MLKEYTNSIVSMIYINKYSLRWNMFSRTRKILSDLLRLIQFLDFSWLCFNMCVSSCVLNFCHKYEICRSKNWNFTKKWIQITPDGLSTYPLIQSKIYMPQKIEWLVNSSHNTKFQVAKNTTARRPLGSNAVHKYLINT